MIFHVQTVFEGEETNTPKRGAEVVEKFGIESPVGYDAHVDGGYVSLIMSQYGTGGTPWTIIIDKKGIVRHNSVSSASQSRDAATAIDETAAKFAEVIEKLRKE